MTTGLLCCLPPDTITDKDRLENAHRLGAEAKANGGTIEDCFYGYEPLAAEWLRGFNGEAATVVDDKFKFIND